MTPAFPVETVHPEMEKAISSIQEGDVSASADAKVL